MVKIFAFAVVAAMASAAPALAQSAGEPGAVGSTGPLSGHNTPGSGVNSRRAYPDNAERGYGEDGPNQGGMTEGRAGSSEQDMQEDGQGQYGRRRPGNINQDEVTGDRNGPDSGR